MKSKDRVNRMISDVAEGEHPATAFDSQLAESSLSRLRSHMVNHDTGIITAFRSEVVDPRTGEKVQLTRKRNLERNRQLRAELLKHYDVTAVRGTYIENYGKKDAKEVGENVFFVVDAHGTGRLLKDLRRLGERFDQDSILFVPQGAEEGFLWGTNKGGWPGYGQKVKLSHPVFGRSGEFMTRVRGRPFVLESTIVEQWNKDYSRGFMGEWARSAIIQKDPTTGE